MTPSIISTSNYTGPERRKYVKTPEQLEEDIRQMFIDHEARERDWINKLIDDFKTEAFPSGDLTGHCGYHESKIRAIKAEEEFWHTAKSEALKHGISGLFAVGKWVVILGLVGLAYKLGFGPAMAKALGV